MATLTLMTTMPPTGWSFTLQVSDEVSGERGGQVRTKQLGPDLWAARYSSTQMPRDMIRRLKAIVGGLMAQRTTFLAWDPHGLYPIADPNGSKLLLPANVKINSVNADAQRMSLLGLPANYVLTAGDYLAFGYGASGARALHQIAPPTTTVAANASGVTPEFYVVPRIRVGWSVNLAVILEKPYCEMLVLPGSLQADEAPRVNSLSFSALQVLP